MANSNVFFILSYLKNVEIIGNKFCYSGKNKFYVVFFKIIARYIYIEFKKYGNLSGQIHVHAVSKLACVIVGLALSCSIVSFEFNKKLY